MTELFSSTNYPERITFYAISCVVHNHICNRYNIDGYPTIVLFPKRTNETIQNNNNNLPQRQRNGTSIYASQFSIEEVVQQFHFTSIDWQRLQEIQETPLFQTKSSSSSLSSFAHLLRRNNNHTYNNKKPGSIWPVRTKQQIYYDVYLSFQYSLRHGIYTSDQPLEEKKQVALRNWLLLLQKVLPYQWYHMKQIIELLLTTQHWNAIILSEVSLIHVLDMLPHPYIDSKTPNNQFTWTTACSKGQMGTGYTCGLWSLFHVVTIGVVEYNILHRKQIYQNENTIHDNVRSSSRETTHYISTESAAETIKDFIAHFFQCNECRHHFLTEYNSCSYQRCQRLQNDTSEVASSLYQWIQLPIWFIETHNGVNVRLGKEEMMRRHEQPNDDEIMNQRLWPSPLHCSTCWKKNAMMSNTTVLTSTTTTTTSTTTRRELNSGNMYEFLKYEYW
jgi:Erv1 / Alr family